MFDSSEQQKVVECPSPDRFRVWSDRVLMTMSLGVIAFGLLQILVFRFGRDQGIYAVVADAILRGAMPYRDVWDFKPPGIFVVYAMARGLFGANQWGIRLLEVLCLAGLVPACATLSKRLFGSSLAGILAAAIAILVNSQLDFWHTSQPETFGGILTIVGMLLATVEPAVSDSGHIRRSTWVGWVGTGAVLGAAGLMKPHLAGASLVVALFVAWKLRCRGLRKRTQAAPLLAVFLGTALPVAACLAWFAAKGALHDLIQTFFVFAPGYGSTTWDSAWWPNYLYYAFEYFAVSGAGPLFLGMVLAITLKPIDERERSGLVLIAGILLIHLVGIAIQSKYFAYHFAATYPVGAVVAGLGAYKLWRRAQRYHAWGVTAFILLFYLFMRARTATRDLGESYWDRSWQRTRAILWGDSVMREHTDAHLYSVADVDYGANMQVVRWIQVHTLLSDPIYIYGFEPFIYDMAGRLPATRYIYNVPQRVAWYRDEARGQLMRDLTARPPRVIVVEHHDVFPAVTGDSLDSEASLATFGALRTLIDTDYELKTTIQDFDLYSRKP